MFLSSTRLSIKFQLLIKSKVFACLQTLKELRALRGKFGPLWSQKLKIVFRQFHPIGLLEE